MSEKNVIVSSVENFWKDWKVWGLVLKLTYWNLSSLDPGLVGPPARETLASLQLLNGASILRGLLGRWCRHTMLLKQGKPSHNHIHTIVNPSDHVFSLLRPQDSSSFQQFISCEGDAKN